MKLSIASTLAAVSLFVGTSLSYDDDHLPPGAAAGNFVSIWYGYSDPPDWHEFHHYPYVDGGAHCCELNTTMKTWPISGYQNTTGSIECKYFEDPKCDIAKGDYSEKWEKQGVKHHVGFFIKAYACRLPFASQEIKPAPANYVKVQ